MDFDRQLRLSSGERLEIPEKLYQSIVAETSSTPAALILDEPSGYLDMILNLSDERWQEASLLALQVAILLQDDQQNCDYGILYLCLYADRKARLTLEMGDQEKALEILLSLLELGNVTFALINPSVARQVADHMIAQSERVLKICSLSGSIQVLDSRRIGLVQALDTAITFWEPDLTALIQRIKNDLVLILTELDGELSQPKARRVHEVVMLVKKDIHRQINRRPGTHLETLNNLVESIFEMFQQEVILTAYTAYTSDGLDAAVIQYQAKSLVEKVEKRLRTLITKKYQQQFRGSWVQHISSKFRPMYERWQRYMQKDQYAFKLYSDYSPQILDYALMEDLKDLIVAQWQLFREVFDFGYQDRNRAVFLDKISQIVNVRNALAHHRMPPENELLRTRVLCTDILLALDRAGEANE